VSKVKKEREFKMFKIVRVYFNGRPRTLKKGLTLEEAQAHCSNPESSSKTCQGSKARARTKRMGMWFDCYDDLITKRK